MPRHVHYVEPYAGGLAVLLARDPFDERLAWGRGAGQAGVSEVVNDINGDLTNFWRVLQDTRKFQEFQRIVAATPFSQTEFCRAAASRATTPVQRAAEFFVHCRQSRAGGFKGFATLSRNRTRRRMNEQASAWWSAVDGLPAIHARLKRVVILCQGALTVIRSQDGEKTLFYLDPPYLPATRASSGNYAHEMTEADHQKMLDTIRQCRGMVLLSGYPSQLYDDALRGWNRHDQTIDNKVSGGATKRIMTEVVWCNF